MSFGFGPFGLIGGMFMILWWALIVVGVFAAAKWLTREGNGKEEHGNPAFDILKERYAKGEIDKKEFNEKKQEIE